GRDGAVWRANQVVWPPRGGAMLRLGRRENRRVGGAAHDERPEPLRVPAQLASHGERRFMRLHPDPEEGPDCHFHLGARGRQAPFSGGPREADSERARRQRSGRFPFRRRPWQVRRIPVEPERDYVQPRGPVQPGRERLRRAAAPGALLLPPSSSGLDAGCGWGPGVRRWEGGLRRGPAPCRTTILERSLRL